MLEGRVLEGGWEGGWEKEERGGDEEGRERMDRWSVGFPWVWVRWWWWEEKEGGRRDGRHGRCERAGGFSVVYCHFADGPGSSHGRRASLRPPDRPCAFEVLRCGQIAPATRAAHVKTRPHHRPCHSHSQPPSPAAARALRHVLSTYPLLPQPRAAAVKAQDRRAAGPTAQSCSHPHHPTCHPCLPPERGPSHQATRQLRRPPVASAT